MSLSELYSEKLNEYKKTRELQVAPSQVLSMLLLDKKDDFFHLSNYWAVNTNENILKLAYTKFSRALGLNAYSDFE